MPIINGPAISTNPWEQACKLQVIRGFDFYKPAPLDPGVNFFVLSLEELGAKTQFSCEGHPRGFYIVFEGSYELAKQINSCGYFSVEIEGDNLWSIRKTVGESNNEVYTEHEKQQVLRGAATAWVRNFGPRLNKTLKAIAIGQLVV